MGSQLYTPEITQDTFDLKPITPGLVKRILKKCSSSSTPGPDKVTYSCLKKLPSTHKFLATLYSKILLQTQECPHTWCTANLSLMYKSGDPTVPANFRPIALTSVLGKIFHKIIASRLEQYAIDNEVIDPSTQKGFLKGINGVIEHTFSMSAILEHARSNGLPVAITFVDLRNAFGSIAHGLIHDTLEALKVPAQVRKYIRNLYAQLKATIRTKQWSSPEFSVKRGVFQGDTLSPIIFLVTFSPIIQLIDTIQSGGFCFKSPVPNSSDLPDPGSHIYVKWEEEDSSDEHGWYHCTVLEYHPDGQVTIRYKDDGEEKITELVDLRLVDWMPARRNGRKFFPICSYPPTIKPKVSRTPKFTLSVPHKAKAYADDLSIISGSLEEHTETVQTIDQLSKEIDLIIRPDKCVTVVFDGKKVLKNHRIELTNGWTRSISEGATKFLGATIATSHQSTASKAKKQLEEKISLALKSIDSRPIRGEYKVWIFRNYVVPSSRFLLTVDPISDNGSDPSRPLPQSLLRNGSDFPEMQHKRSFSTQRPSIVHIFQPRG